MRAIAVMFLLFGLVSSLAYPLQLRVQNSIEVALIHPEDLNRLVVDEKGYLYFWDQHRLVKAHPSGKVLYDHPFAEGILEDLTFASDGSLIILAGTRTLTKFLKYDEKARTVSAIGAIDAFFGKTFAVTRTGDFFVAGLQEIGPDALQIALGRFDTRSGAFQMLHTEPKQGKVLPSLYLGAGSDFVYFYSTAVPEVSVWDAAGRLSRKISVPFEGKLMAFATLGASGLLFQTILPRQVDTPGTVRLVLLRNGMGQTVKEWKIQSPVPAGGDPPIGTLGHVAPPGRLYFVIQRQDHRPGQPRDKLVITVADLLL